MSIAALALAATVCSWNNPGMSPFMGDVVAAVDNYYEIPNNVRIVLKEKIGKHKYDDIATIARNSIQGTSSYGNLRQMHFGDGTICPAVTYDWPVGVEERGLVFCEQNYCIIIPTVCRNVSRIDRLQTNNFLKQETREYSANISEATEVVIDPVAFSLSETNTEETPDDSFRTWVYSNYSMALPFIHAAFPIGAVAPIPEPSSGFLILLGLAAIAAFNWYRRRK